MEEDKLIEKVEQVKKELVNNQEVDFLSEAIRNNELEFEHKSIKYRVRKPTYMQKLKVNDEKMKKYHYLLKQKNSDGTHSYLLEEDWIKFYKEERNIDIGIMDENYKVLDTKKKDLALKLGRALTEDKSQEELDVYKKEIEKVTSEQQDIMIKKSILLDASIEAQVNLFSYSYLAYLILEKYVKGEDLGNGNKNPDPGWMSAFSSLEDFLNQEESSVNLLMGYAVLMSRHEIPLA